MILMGCKISEKNLKIPKKRLDKAVRLWIMVANIRRDRMRTLFLQHVDRFFYAVERWSRRLAWVAIIAAVVIILIPAIIRIMGR